MSAYSYTVASVKTLHSLLEQGCDDHSHLHQHAYMTLLQCGLVSYQLASHIACKVVLQLHYHNFGLNFPKNCILC